MERAVTLRRSRFFLGVVAVIALVSTACTAASLSPSPAAVASPQPSPSSSLSSMAESISPGASATDTPALEAATDTPSATDTPEATPTDSPTPPLPKGPLPSLGPVPIGTWTGLKWIAIPGGNSPVVPRSDPNGDSNATLESWSRGYIEFMWDPYKRTLLPYGSSDGLRWLAGPALDISAWTADLKRWDSNPPDMGSTIDDDPTDCEFQVSQFQEGPASLLMVGYVECWTAGCGSVPFFTRDAMWTSDESGIWNAVDLATAFPGGNFGIISGSSKGFITLTEANARPALLTSADGRTWTPGTLPAAVLTKGSTVSVPEAFAGGYVLPGVIMEKAGYQSSGTGGGGCAGGWGATNTSLYQAALWFSPDGTSWTRDALIGTTASYNGVAITVGKLDEHTLVADEEINGVDLEWVSLDGHTWTGLKSDALPGSLIYGRSRSLFEVAPNDPGLSAPAFCVLGANFQSVQLRQSGDAPWWGSILQKALGPTGLLVTIDGSRFWMGLPTAG